MIGKKKYRGSIAFARKNGRPLVRGQFIQPLERRLYLSSGNLDLTFGNQGMAAVPQLGSVRCSAIQPDGKILVAGSVEHFNPNTSATTADFEILRLNTDGSLDTSFGTQGAVFEDFGGNEDTPSAMVVDSSGKIYVIGASADWRQPTRYSDLVIAALNSDGSLNSSFLGGTVAPSNPGFERGTSIALDGDQLVLGGCAGASITN